MELQISGLLKHSTVVQVHRYCLEYFLVFYEFYVKKKNTFLDNTNICQILIKIVTMIKEGTL